MEIKTHEIYDKYEFNQNGLYRLINSTEWLTGYSNGQYLLCSIAGKNGIKKTKSVHKAIWECFKGEIPKGYEIDHIDNDKRNNNINNLQCVSPNDNKKRRNHDFLVEIRKNARKPNINNIKGINTLTKEEHIFKTKTQAGKFYGCSPGLIYNICEKKAKNKTFAGNIKFEYTIDEPNKIVPSVRIGKKYNKINKQTEEEKKEKQKLATKKYYEKKRTQKLAQIIQ